jgi:uncharacterized protein
MVKIGSKTLTKFVKKWLLPLVAVLIGLGLIDHALANILTDLWWFQGLGYAQNYWLQIQTQIWLALMGSGLAGLWLGGNYYLARQWQVAPPYPAINFSLMPEPLPMRLAPRPILGLPLLLIINGGSLLLMGSIVVYGWQLLHLPTLARVLLIALILLWSIGTLVWTSGGLSLLIVALSIAGGYYWATHWQLVLPAIAPTNFPQVEPVFNQNISFYIFHLPMRELVDQYLLILTGMALLITIFLYLRPHVSNGYLEGFTPAQRRHLLILGSAIAWAITHHFVLARYQLLYSQRGVVYGAGYTDLQVHLPIDNLWIIGSCALGLYLLLLAMRPGWGIKSWRWILGAILLLIGSSLVLPVITQSSIVQPNELAQEKPYIQRNIDFTRQAFELDRIEVKTFDPTGTLTAQDIANNDQTIKNIRLWDARPLLQSNRELQQIRPYYQFANADIDRYPIRQENQQVMLSARELDINNLTAKAQTWVNRHLVYTHGYGFTASPVNRAAAGGLPDYLVKDIGIGNGDLPASDPVVDVEQPRIYFGEVADNYIFTPTRVPEFDYPSGDKNAYNTYDGQSGVSLNNWWRRWMVSRYLQDWQVLLTTNFTPQTKVLLHRQITERVQKLAPWLRFDQDPYLVVAPGTATKANHLFWILDGYSTSNHYPYADPGTNGINYIRNSVKVIVDAYDGQPQFYVSDPQDPILRTWQRLLPRMWKPLNQMPTTLRAHLRYPSDLFRMQSDRLLTYHMQDPQVFYNREDLWQIPQEIYAGKAQVVKPYYLITKLPTAPQAEFILLSPFTPSQRTNLIAWLAARADGEQYGKLLLYQFPKQQLVYGPEQIESLINQDPVISQQISLWNRQGVRAVQGNLLVIPIERSLLYVEPLYLEAQQNGLPTLGRVIVVYRDQIVMAKTLTQALQSIFPAISSPSS